MSVLAIDLGTSGVKVALVDDEGRVLAAEQAALVTTFTDDGGAEQDAERWWLAIGECARAVMRDHDTADVDVVAVTSQYTSIVPIDRDGTPVGPVIMWMDRRGARHLRAKQLDVDVDLWLTRHGMVPAGACDQAHIAYLHAERPDVAARATAFVEPVDAITARLTGRVTATQSTAFPLMTVDARTHGVTHHDDDLVAALRLDGDDDKLPPLIGFDEVVGTVTPRAAEHLGITTGAHVVPGTIDSITSAIGTGVVDHATCGLVIGTTSVVVTHVDRKDADLDHALVTIPSPLPNRWFVMAENGVGGRAVERAVDLLGAPDIAALEAQARTSPPGANGVHFLPWLAGSIAPAPDGRARAGFLNIGLTTARADLARAVYEGVALNAAWLLPHVEALARPPAPWPSIRFGGGGAASTFWAQALADALDRRVDRLANHRATNARGAALLALAQRHRIAVADIPALVDVASAHEPDPTSRDLHAANREHLADLHAALQGFHRARNRGGG